MERTPSATSHLLRALRVPATGLFALLLVTGCGGAEDPDPPAAPAAPTTSPEPQAATTTTSEPPAAPTTSPEPPAATTPAEDLVLTISDFSYRVPERVEPGATVTVRNEDGVGHTVTSDEEGVFDVVVGPGEQVSFTVPDEAGDYPFHCTPHPAMTGVLVVG